MKSFILSLQWNPKSSFTPKIGVTIESDSLYEIVSKLLIEIVRIKDMEIAEAKQMTRNELMKIEDDIPF